MVLQLNYEFDCAENNHMSNEEWFLVPKSEQAMRFKMFHHENLEVSFQNFSSRNNISEIEKIEEDQGESVRNRYELCMDIYMRLMKKPTHGRLYLMKKIAIPSLDAILEDDKKYK